MEMKLTKVEMSELLISIHKRLHKIRLLLKLPLPAKTRIRLTEEAAEAEGLRKFLLFQSSPAP